MPHPVAFFEVVSPDHERSQAFYGQLFGWHVAPDPAMGGYALVDTGAGEGAVPGGIGPGSAPGESGARFYVRVEDLEATLARAEELGAARLLPPTELPGGWGTIALFADPDGTAVGLRA